MDVDFKGGHWTLYNVAEWDHSIKRKKLRVDIQQQKEVEIKPSV